MQCTCPSLLSQRSPRSNHLLEFNNGTLPKCNLPVSDKSACPAGPQCYLPIFDNPPCPASSDPPTTIALLSRLRGHPTHSSAPTVSHGSLWVAPHAVPERPAVTDSPKQPSSRSGSKRDGPYGSRSPQAHTRACATAAYTHTAAARSIVHMHVPGIRACPFPAPRLPALHCLAQGSGFPRGPRRHGMLDGVHACQGVVPSHIAVAQQVAGVAVERGIGG